MKFEVGDKVRAFGCDGVVTKILKSAEFYTILLIDFGFTEAMFTEDGKYMSWHKEPSLQLIEKANKKKKNKIVLREALFGDEKKYWTRMYSYKPDDLYFIKWIEGGRTLEVEVDE